MNIFGWFLTFLLTLSTYSEWKNFDFTKCECDIMTTPYDKSKETCIDGKIHNKSDTKAGDKSCTSFDPSNIVSNISLCASKPECAQRSLSILKALIFSALQFHPDANQRLVIHAVVNTFTHSGGSLKLTENYNIGLLLVIVVSVYVLRFDFQTTDGLLGRLRMYRRDGRGRYI